MKNLFDLINEHNEEVSENIKKFENPLGVEVDFRILDPNDKLKALSDNLIFFSYHFLVSLFTTIPDVLTNKNISVSNLPCGRFVKEDSDQDYFIYETNTVLSPIEIKEELDKGKKIIIFTQPKIVDNDIKLRCFVY